MGQNQGVDSMKIILYVLIYLFFIMPAAVQGKDEERSELSGRIFVGKPVKEVSEPGCEGCGEPGYIKFEDSRRFEMAWPGSDEIESGTYTRKGLKIYIRIGDAGKAHLFVLSKDGIQLVCREMNFFLRDKRYPWKK